jgi:uncharacterized membrane protein YdbT with pleckstrin-like domain
VVPTLLGVLVLAGAGIVGLLSIPVLLVVFAVAGCWTAGLCGRWYATSFTLTRRTLVLRRGLMVRSCRLIALETLQDAATEQSVLGALLGYGTVELSLLSGGRERLSPVPDPEVVRDRIFSTRLDGTA